MHRAKPSRSAAKGRAIPATPRTSTPEAEARPYNQRCTGCVADGLVCVTPPDDWPEGSGHRSRSRSLAAGPAGREWGQDLESAGGELRVIAARPDGRLRQMAPQNDGSTSCTRECRHPRSQQPVAPPDAFSVGPLLVHRFGPAWLTAACGEMAAGGGCQRSSRNDWGYVEQRAFDKACLPNRTLRRLTFAASIGHQGQRGRAPRISPGRPDR